MTDTTINSPVSKSFQQHLLEHWQELTKPIRPAKSVLPREQQLLITISASLVLLTICCVPIVFMLKDASTVTTLTQLAAVSMVTYSTIYLLARRGYYIQSATLLILAVITIPYMAVVTDTSPTQSSRLVIGFSIMSVVIAGNFLSLRYIAIFAILCAVAIVLSPVFNRNIDFDTVLWSLTLLSAFTMITTVFGRHRNGLEADRRQQLTALNEQLQVSENALKLANLDLEKRVQERTAELIEAKERAERSDQVKSAFLASMSHELRTPLNAVINFTRFVVDGDTGPVNEQQTELLTEVINSAKHLLNLINDVLDMSKIEAGSLNLFIEDDISLAPILDSSVATARSLLQNKSVRLETEIDPTLPPITGDRQRLLQILLNIISNACKFTQEGEIRLRAAQRDGEVVISVADTGPGIAREDQSLVFEPFKQTSTGLRQGGGTGLGMPIAKSLAEAHGGRLWLESELGKGAAFYIALPLKSETLVPVLA